MIVFILFAVCLIHTVAGNTDLGYPTLTQAGFHHNALLYLDGGSSPEKLKYWLTGSYASLDSLEILFDTITTIVERTPWNSQTAYSTNQRDWSWLLTTPYFGPYGIFSNLTQAMRSLNTSNKQLQVIVMLPYLDPYGQTNFSATLDFSKSSDRKQAIEWYVDTIVNEVKQYPELSLWGIYLMREDIVGTINEDIAREISEIVHQRQLRLLWIPYASAINWNSWANFGIDVAILQPNYAFASPLVQGTFNVGRLRAAAKLAQCYGLGIEIEVNQGAATDYDLALLQNYLAQGSIDGYQFVPTAYFLGNYERIAQSKKACDLLRNYTLGQHIQPTFAWNKTWIWTKDPNLQAVTDISSDIRPTAVRISWSPKNQNWFGSVQLEGYVEMNRTVQWQMLSTSEIGEKSWRDGDYPSILLAFSLLPAQIIRSLRLTFLRSNFHLSLTDTDLIIEQIPNGIALQTSIGAPYRISPSMFSPDPQYGDSSTQTLADFQRGLLTDDQWSTKEWQSTMSIGWLETPSAHQYVRIALDFGSPISIDQISVRLHGGSYSSINWPNTARLLISADCVPFSSFSTSSCKIKSYPSSDPLVTGGTETNQGGVLTFSFSSTVRWAVLEFQPNAWLMIDEIQAFANEVNLSHLIKYYLLSPPTTISPSSPSLAYPDDGTRLTDGLITGTMGSITGWMKGDAHTITIDLLVPRLIREASVWSLILPSWAISAPNAVIISTSLDGVTWDVLGERGQAQVGERILDAQRMYVTANHASLARYIKYYFPIDQAIPGWWTMISEVTATE